MLLLPSTDVLLRKDVLKGKITEEEAQESKARITTTSDISAFKDVDFAIEVRISRCVGNAVSIVSGTNVSAHSFCYRQ